jgi:hypothetical protein
VQAIGGVDRQDGADVVVLGVDTHLDLNVGVALVHDQATSRADLLTNPAKHSCRDTGRDSKALKVPR